MNNLPEKIYATPNFDRRWQTKAIDDESVEYIQKDAFIEKACEWISTHSENYIYKDEEMARIGCLYSYLEKDLFIKDFKKYMEE